MYDYDIHNGQVTGDIAYKYSHKNDTSKMMIDFTNLRLYVEKQKEKDRKEFLDLLLNDEIVKNNRALQEKYMELYDKYTGR